MRISIVTVAYNSAATLADTLRSVARQTHPDIEHIVIDGGSTDGTAALVRQFGDRVRTFVSEPDGGIYDAMNKGLARATGDFVGFLNADDFYATDDAVAAIVDAATDGVDAVYGDLVYVRQGNTDEVVRYWRSGGFDRRRLRYGWMPPHPTLYIRRSLVEAHGGFDLRFRIAGDYDFMLRYLGRPGARVAYVDRVLVKMRSGGASNRSWQAVLRKSREDLAILRRHDVGGLLSLLCKNVRKLPQLFASPP